MRTGSNIRQRIDGRFEARYEKGRDENGHIIYGSVYAATYEEAEAKRAKLVEKKSSIRQMNLLILGAGDHGQEVKELAEGLRVFNKIAFLDDNPDKEGVIGPCTDFEQYLDDYPMAIAAVGDSTLRCQWMNELIKVNFIIPTFVHPTAVVSASVEIEPGTVICANSTIGQKVHIGRGSIVDSGAVVERNAVVPDWTYIKCGDVFSKK